MNTTYDILDKTIEISGRLCIFVLTSLYLILDTKALQIQKLIIFIIILIWALKPLIQYISQILVIYKLKKKAEEYKNKVSKLKV